MTEEKIKIYVDGSGNGKFGFQDENGYSEVFQQEGTNNQNEYRAVKQAILYAFSKGKLEIEILSDSKLIVEQLNHNWHIKDDILRKLAIEIWNIIKGYNLNVKFSWIPREQNKAGKLLG